jgi:hypothetical protein
MYSFFKDPGIICRVLDACHDKDLQIENTPMTKEWTPIDLSQIKIKILNEKEAVIKAPAQEKPLSSAVNYNYFKLKFIFIPNLIELHCVFEVNCYKWSRM